MGEAWFGKRATIEIAKHDAEVPGASQRGHDRLDCVPVVAVLDVRRAWRELKRKEAMDLVAEGAVCGIENEVAHRSLI